MIELHNHLGMLIFVAPSAIDMMEVCEIKPPGPDYQIGVLLTLRCGKEVRVTESMSEIDKRIENYWRA